MRVYFIALAVVFVAVAGWRVFMSERWEKREAAWLAQYMGYNVPNAADREAVARHRRATVAIYLCVAVVCCALAWLVA